MMKSHFIRHFQRLCAAAVVSAALVPVAASAEPVTAVIELFTSQGCSSCPPADQLLGELAERPGVLALSMPVDYWDYLGWKDTFADHAYTERQRGYATARGDGQVYTPQVVVNGLEHAVGSRASEIDKAVATSWSAVRNQAVAVSSRVEGDTVVIDVGASPAGVKAKPATVWVVHVLRHGEVAIKRGENSGLKVVYTNVVRKLTPVGAWTGQALSIKLAKAELMATKSDGCAVLLQADGQGPMLGAAPIASW